MSNRYVDEVIRELNDRIDLFENDMPHVNLDDYEAIEKILDTRIRIAPHKVIASDIAYLEKDDVKTILSRIDLTPEEVEEIISKFDEYKKEYNPDKFERQPEVYSYFDSIKDRIVNYAIQFHAVSNHQFNVVKDKITEYRKMIDILTSDQIISKEEINLIYDFMKKTGYSDETIYNVLISFGNRNVLACEENKMDVNTNKKVEDVLKDNIFDDAEILDAINKYLENSVIDTKLIPTIAENIANESSKSKEEIQNALTYIVVKTLLERYNKTHDKKVKDEIYDLIELFKPTEDEVITYVKTILDMNSEMYNDAIMDNIDSDDYINYTVDELVLEGFAFETAIEIKVLPVLKRMSETIAILLNLASDTEEYKLQIDNLRDLIYYYEEFMKMKKDKKKNKQG